MIERPRWAWEELQPGDMIQDKDEWQNEDGRWHTLVMVPGASTQLRDGLRARRPHNITMMLAAFANQAEVLAQAREASQQLLQTITDNADQFAWANKTLEQERDEARAEVTQLRAERQEYTAKFEAEVTAAALVIDELTATKDALKSAQRARDELQRQVDELRADRRDEPTARQVQEVLRRWATELDWSADCFGSFGRSQIDIIQQTMIAVIQRIGSMIDPEATSADT